VHLSNNRLGFLAAAEKAKQAAAVAELMSGAEGAIRRSTALIAQANNLNSLGDMAQAARVACAALRAARAAGNRTCVVRVVGLCGAVARNAPGEMARAERESREHEKLSDSPPSFGGPDLSQEGRISLPTTPAALSRLSLTYREAAVALCDATLAAKDGRVAGDDERHVPTLRVEAESRGQLGVLLYELGGEPQRSADSLRKAVALLRQAVRETTSGSRGVLNATSSLAHWLTKLGDMIFESGSDGLAEAEACMREALKLGEEMDDVHLHQSALRTLINMSGQPGQSVGLAEAAELRSRLTTQDAKAGRSIETSSTICLEPLEPPGGFAEQDAEGGTPSAVRVLRCGHQYHLGCLSTWWNTASYGVCPVCKE